MLSLAAKKFPDLWEQYKRREAIEQECEKISRFFDSIETLEESEGAYLSLQGLKKDFPNFYAQQTEIVKDFFKKALDNA